jgi:hypothetical protein
MDPRQHARGVKKKRYYNLPHSFFRFHNVDAADEKPAK